MSNTIGQNFVRVIEGPLLVNGHLTSTLGVQVENLGKLGGNGTITGDVGVLGGGMIARETPWEG